MKHRLGSDDGVSLTELMIVVALLGFILAAAWGLQYAANKAVNVNTSLATGASALGDPVEFMSRIIMQARSVVTAGTDGNTLTVKTERKLGTGIYEKNYFHIDTSKPATLTWNWYNYNSSTNATVASGTYARTLGTTSSYPSGVPLFTYYGMKGDSADQTLTPPGDLGTNGGNLRSVLIQLATQKPDGSWMTVSRKVTLRNTPQ